MDDDIADEIDDAPQLGDHSTGGARDADGNILRLGDRIEAKFKGKGVRYFPGQVTAVNPHRDGSFTFDLAYDDGDMEENALPANIRRTGPPPRASSSSLDRPGAGHATGRKSAQPLVLDDDERTPARAERDIRDIAAALREKAPPAPSAYSGAAPRPSTAGVQRTGVPAARSMDGPPSSTSPKRWTLPVTLPAAALEPPLRASQVSVGATRTRDTVIVRRAVPPPPPSTTAAPKVISVPLGSGPPPRIPGEGGVYHDDHMEELTHGRKAKAAAAARRAAEERKAAQAAEEARRLYMRGGFTGESPLGLSEGGASGDSGMGEKGGLSEGGTLCVDQCCLRCSFCCCRRRRGVPRAPGGGGAVGAVQAGGRRAGRRVRRPRRQEALRRVRHRPGAALGRGGGRDEVFVQVRRCRLVWGGSTAAAAAAWG